MYEVSVVIKTFYVSDGEIGSGNLRVAASVWTVLEALAKGGGVTERSLFVFWKFCGVVF